MSSEVKPTGPETATGSASGGRTVTLVGLGTALVLVTYITPVATAVQTTAGLDAGPVGRAWVLSSMSVGLAAALLASGSVGDAVGRRRTYLVGLAVLGLGAVVCAVAQDPLVFVAARILQGAGGAAMLACGLAILAHVFPSPEERSRATAVWGASVGLGITAGAVVAAAMGSFGSGWREASVVTAVAAGGLLLASRRLPESAAEHARRLDVAGLVALSGGLTLLVSGLTEVRTGVSARGVLLLVLAALLLVVFAVVEARTSEPLIEPALWRSGGFVAATLGSLAVGTGVVGMTTTIPTLVQLELGGTLWQATWLVFAWSATSVVTSLLVRRLAIARSGPLTIAASLAVVGVAQLTALGVGPGSSEWRLLPATFVAGLATGVLNAVLGREAVTHVPRDRAAMGSGANNTARYLGAAVGITVCSVLLAHVGWDATVWFAATVSLLGALVTGLVGRAAR